MRKLNLLFVMLLSLMGVTQVYAQVTDDFTSYSATSSGQTLGDNWYVFPGDDDSYGRFGSDYTYKHNEYDGADYNYVSGYSSNYTKNVWLVMKKQVSGSVTFRSKMYRNSGTLYVTNKVTAVGDGTFTVDKTGAQSYSITTTASSNTYDAGSTATYVAFCLASSDLRLLDVTYTEASAAEGAVLSVSGFESGSSFDFGTVPAGETKTFTLNNLGADELTITSIAVSGDFEITDGSDITSIASMGSASVTVATPDKDASGALTIVSNDENSPYVISLTSTYKVPAPIIALDPTEVEFGKVTENASQVITVSNSGEAELVGTITSDNPDFTVSPSEINVPVGETAEFTVTYNYDVEAYGAHTATITVTPTVGEAATLAVSAKVADPNLWSEDFQGEGQPEGWEVGSSNWTFANGVARATYGSYSTGYKYFLTTPTLEVAEGESLEFQYRGTANYTDIRIQMSKDGGEFEDFETISCNTMNEFETYVIDGLEPGNYQFRFANDNYELDNFEGFKLAVLEHDMAITASDIPSRGDTASEYVASVTVQEKAGKDETVTAKLYIDGNVVATAEQEVAANEEATIELSFEPTEAVVFKKAYIEITYAEGLTKKTDEVSVYIQEVTVKVLDEVAVNEFSGTTETYDRVKLNYTVKQGWNTIAVPFMISD
ncbi:MAG: choice-of-anchor D domain-containing protein, partial [Prevotella sp.]|nr:choice-of-anchor D domain-containing protein [Prevotella sp.]